LLRDVHPEDLVPGEGAILEGVRLVARLLQVLGGELGFVDDDEAARLQVADVDAQRRGVQGNQGIGLVAGRLDVGAGEGELEPGNAGERTLGCADLSR